MRKKVNKFLREFYLEIILFLLLITGFFLLIADFNLKSYIQNITGLFFYYIKVFLTFMHSKIYNEIKIIRLSNFLGFLILLFTLFLMYHRWRKRLLNLKNTSKFCNMCDTKRYRKKKSKYFMFLEKFLRLNISAYQCKKCRSTVHLYKKK